MHLVNVKIILTDNDDNRRQARALTYAMDIDTDQMLDERIKVLIDLEKLYLEIYQAERSEFSNSQAKRIY